jgi:hypothetical protein
LFGGHFVHKALEFFLGKPTADPTQASLNVLPYRVISVAIAIANFFHNKIFWTIQNNYLELGVQSGQLKFRASLGESGEQPRRTHAAHNSTRGRRCLNRGTLWPCAAVYVLRCIRLTLRTSACSKINRLVPVKSAEKTCEYQTVQCARLYKNVVIWETFEVCG